MRAISFLGKIIIAVQSPAVTGSAYEGHQRTTTFTVAPPACTR